MKIRIVIFYAFSSLLCLFAHSCKRFSLYTENETPLHYTVLQTINDTMTCCPDVALNILIGVSDTIDEQQLPKPDYYEYQILIAEALYKNIFSQTNDSAIIESVKFYDSLANIYPQNVDVLFQKSRAHYYKAVGETEKGNVKSACEEYIVSLKTIDKITKKDRNYNMEYFNGLIYNRLARIYYDFTNDCALKLYIKAYESYIKCHSYFSAALNCYSIAKLLSSDNKYDESEIYLTKADSLVTCDSVVDEFAKKMLLDDIAMARALNLCNTKNKCHDALYIIKELYKHSESIDIKFIRSAVLAEMYYQNNIIDSALYYYEMAFENNHYAKMTAASRIVEISKITGDNDRIAYYAPYLAEETSKELDLAPLKAELVAMYEQYEEEKHKEEIRVLWLKIIMALVLSIIGLVVVFHIMSIIRRRKHTHEINRKNLYIDSLQGKIKKTKAENKSAQESIKSLEKQLSDNKNIQVSEPVSFAERMNNIKSDELCKKLLAITQMHIKTTIKYPDLVLSDNEKLHIVELFDKELDGAIHNVIVQNPRLRKSDEILFCLTLIGLDEKRIAAVMGTMYHNVFVRSQKCLEILGGDGDLETAVRSAVIVI